MKMQRKIQGLFMAYDAPQIKYICILKNEVIYALLSHTNDSLNEIYTINMLDFHSSEIMELQTKTVL